MQRLKVPCLVNIFTSIDSGFFFFTKAITFSLWRNNLEHDKETNAGYVDILKSNESTKQATKKKNLALTMSWP